MAADEEDEDSGSEAASEGTRRLNERPTYTSKRDIDLPPRTPSKKHDRDEESVTSSNKRDGSPVLKKASTTLQLRSEFPTPIMMTGTDDDACY